MSCIDVKLWPFLNTLYVFISTSNTIIKCVWTNNNNNNNKEPQELVLQLKKVVVLINNSFFYFIIIRAKCEQKQFTNKRSYVLLFELLLRPLMSCNFACMNFTKMFLFLLFVGYLFAFIKPRQRRAQEIEQQQQHKKNWLNVDVLAEKKIVHLFMVLGVFLFLETPWPPIKYFLIIFIYYHFLWLF